MIPPRKVSDTTQSNAAECGLADLAEATEPIAAEGGMLGILDRLKAIRSLATFLVAYVKSMRLYYAFITGIAGWIGVGFARYLFPESISTLRAAIILVILFMAWGINQIVNDFLGLKEDRINAPQRPMVTGELHLGAALSLSGLLLCLCLAVTWFLAPLALIPLIMGVLLNVAYEYAKGIPILGNIIFGIMIATCTAYGYLATTPEQGINFTPSRNSVLLLVALMNALMTYYTYFKDYRGDQAAGKITAVVWQGIRGSRITALVVSPIPSIALALLMWADMIVAPANNVFNFLFVVTLFIQIWTGVLYYLYPTGAKAYYSLVTNFRACTCGQVTLIALFNQELALYLYIASYVFIGFLFDLHRNRNA